MFPREVKEIDGKQYIEYKGYKEMRDMESKVEGEKIELFKENKKLKEENKKLKDENLDLKSELSKFRDSFKKYRDYEKEELAESCYDLAMENEKLKEEIGKLVMKH